MVITSLSALGRGLLLAVLFGTIGAGEPPPASSLLAGGPLTYAARWGDSLTRVAARFGMDVPVLAELNGLKPTARLQLGQELHIDNPHLVPLRLDDGIVINIPQRMLFYFKSGKLEAAYPAALGRRTWRTPVGDFEVLEKVKEKTWLVPLSIQKEMVRKGLPLQTKVPPGPSNPLGRYWIRISESEGIHGTNAPASIYTFRTHGCIRLSPEHIASLYQQVPIGTPVRIVYEPVLLARLPDGNYYLEVHPDIYRKAGDPLTTVRQAAAAAGADSMLDWQEVRKAIRERRGLAEDVSLAAVQTP
jgi:L,D-transpeptidase ErfK/SrfK